MILIFVKNNLDLRDFYTKKLWKYIYEHFLKIIHNNILLYESRRGLALQAKYP